MQGERNIGLDITQADWLKEGTQQKEFLAPVSYGFRKWIIGLEVHCYWKWRSEDIKQRLASELDHDAVDKYA